MRKSTYSQIKRSIRRSGLTVFLTRIGTGRHVQIGIYGPDSAQVAAALDHMLTRCPMSGDGSSPHKMIVMDRDPALKTSQ